MWICILPSVNDQFVRKHILRGYTCMYVCMHACMYVCVVGWTYVCIYACIYVCMYALYNLAMAWQPHLVGLSSTRMRRHTWGYIHAHKCTCMYIHPNSHTFAQWVCTNTRENRSSVAAYVQRIIGGKRDGSRAFVNFYLPRSDSAGPNTHDLYVCTYVCICIL
jgi:hypothetical protein